MSFVQVIRAFFVTMLLISPSFASAANLNIDPIMSSVSTGDTFTILVNISNVNDLYDYQFDLNFNPTIIRAGSISEESFLSDAGTTFFIPGNIDNVGGSVSFNADTLLGAVSGASGSGTLLDFTFVALDSGISNLTLSNVVLQDSTGNLLSSTLAGGAVDVGGNTAIPEPSSFIFLSIGVLGAAVRRHLMTLL